MRKCYYFALMLAIFVGITGAMCREVCARSVERVLLTPHSAALVIHEDVPVINRKATFRIPPQAKPDTLKVKVKRPDSVQILFVSVKMLEEREDEAIKKLGERIDQLRTEYHWLEARKKAVQQAIDGWVAQSQGKFETLEGLPHFLQTVQNTLLKLHKELVKIEKQLELKQQELKKLEKELEELTGNLKKEWQVTCYLDSVPPGTENIRLQYSAIFSNAGWTPEYTVDAYPRDGKVVFQWKARVWQHTGMVWKDAKIRLATMEPPESIIPPELPYWNIEVYEETRSIMKKRSAFMLAGMAPAPKKLEKDMVEKEKKSGFDIYSVGTRTVYPGKDTIIPVEKLSWEADFQYLLRPFVNPWAYILAKVKLAQASIFPEATATFLLEGTYVGQERLSISGSEKVFYFGPDRLVSAKMVLDEKLTGERGFFHAKKSFLWKWHFLLKNDHDYPVTVKLEERKPVASDERIVFKEIKTPDLSEVESEDPHKWAWKVKLKPREERQVSFLVHVLVPEKMQVDPGW